METTIVGIATAIGTGGIAIVRISGEKAIAMFEKVFVPAKQVPPYESHRLMYGHIVDGEQKMDEAMGVVMHAPATYTCEPVCEIHTHGGQMAVNETIQLLLKQGAELAEPGEFTKRAFMNGRIGLPEAEAVMGAIHAQSKVAYKAAVEQLNGGQSQFIHALQAKVISMLAGMEAHIDYPDEIDEEEAMQTLLSALDETIIQLESAIDERSARMIQEGLRVALCGAPNAGKSTLFNALIGEERAIVTEIAGTTRDVLTGQFSLDGVTVHLYDTAGIRESDDRVEQIGVNRAKKTLAMADVAFLLIDGTKALNEDEITLMQATYDCPVAVILTKSDEATKVTFAEISEYSKDANILSLSAKTGDGLKQISEFLRQYVALPQQHYLTQQRHIQLAIEVLQRLRETKRLVEEKSPLELSTVDLHEALYLLGRITGEEVDEKLLDDIFSTFCVGK